MQSFSITVVVLTLIVSITFAQDATRFECKDGKFGPSASTREKLAVCHKSEDYGTGEGKKDLKCRAFCFTEAIRGLKDGLPDKAVFEQLIDTEFPEGERKTAKEGISFCFEKHGKIDLKDEKCVNIAALSACATSLINKASCPQ